MVGLFYSWLSFFPPFFFFPAFSALFMILHLPPVELAGSLRCTPNSGEEATPFLYSTTVRASLLDHFYFLFCSNYTKIWETRDTTGGDENPQSSVSLLLLASNIPFLALFWYQLFEIVIYNLTLYKSIVISNIVKRIPKTPSGIWECTVSWEREKRYSLPLCLGPSH